MAKNAYVFNSMSFTPNNQHPAMDKIVGNRNSARFSRIPRYIVSGKSQNFKQTVVGNQQQFKSSRDKDKCLAGFDVVLQSAVPAIKSSVVNNSENNNHVSNKGSRYVKRMKKTKNDHNSKFRKLNARISKHINRWMNDVDKEISNISNQRYSARQTKDLIRITGEIKKNFTVVLDRIEQFPLLSEKQTQKCGAGAVMSSLGGNSRGGHHDKIATEVVQSNQSVNRNTRPTSSKRIKRDLQDSSISQRHNEKTMRATNIDRKTSNNNDVDNGVRVESPMEISSESILQRNRKVSDGRTNLFQYDDCQHSLENSTVNASTESHQMIDKDFSLELPGKRLLSDGDHEGDSLGHFTKEAPSERFYGKHSLECYASVLLSDVTYYSDSLESSARVLPSNQDFDKDSSDYAEKLSLPEGLYETGSSDCPLKCITTNETYNEDSLNYSEKSLSENLYDRDSMDCPVKSITTNNSYKQDTLNHSEKSLSGELYEADSLDCSVNEDSKNEIYGKHSSECSRKFTSSAELCKADSLDGSASLGLLLPSKSECSTVSERHFPSNSKCETDSLECKIKMFLTEFNNMTKCKDRLEKIYRKIYGSTSETSILIESDTDYRASLHGASTVTLVSESEESSASKCWKMIGRQTFTKLYGDRLHDVVESPLSRYATPSDTLMSESETNSGTVSLESFGGSTLTILNRGRLLKTEETASSLNESIDNSKYIDLDDSGTFSDLSVWFQSDKDHRSSPNETASPLNGSIDDSEYIDLNDSGTFSDLSMWLSSDTDHISSPNETLTDTLSTTEVNNLTKYKDRLEEIYRKIYGSTSETSIIIESDTDYRASLHGASTVTLVSESEEGSESKCWKMIGRQTFTKLYGDRLHDVVESPSSRYATPSETPMSESETNSGTVSLESLSGSTFTILNGGRFSKTEETASPLNEFIDNSEYIDLDDSGTFSDLSVWLESDTDHISSPNETVTDSLTSYTDSLNELSF